MMGQTRMAGLVFATALAATVSGQTPATTPPSAIRQIPGITAKDVYPNGCVDCHVTAKDNDVRMSARMTQWASTVPAALVEKAKAASVDPSKIKSKHLPIPNVKANVPQSCLNACHKKGSTIAPPFGQLLHSIHLTGGSQNRFMTVYQGECTHCHKMDQKTGLWKIPSAAEK